MKARYEAKKEKKKDWKNPRMANLPYIENSYCESIFALQFF